MSGTNLSALRPAHGLRRLPTWKRQIREALEHLFHADPIVVASFDKLTTEIEKDALADHWKLGTIKDFLDEKLDDLSAADPRNNDETTSVKADVVVVCALSNPELAALRGIGEWSELPSVVTDPQTYYITTWVSESNRSPIRIVAAACSYMGLTAAGVLAAKMVWRFRPHLVAMVGIAAGVSDTTQGFGDILAPQVTYDYGSSKTKEVDGVVRVVPNPHPLAIDPKLLARLITWLDRFEDLAKITQDWKAARPQTRLSLHIGPVFSSPTVLDVKAPVEAELAHWRKLIGVEMEAHAVHRAASDTLSPARLFVCFKSICDFAENKNNAWQHYAAFTAANFFHRFLVKEWDALTPPRHDSLVMRLPPSFEVKCSGTSTQTLTRQG